MNRARFALAAMLVGAACVGANLLAQSAPPTPQLKSVLAGKKFEPPLKGQVEVEYTTPTTKRDKDQVVTTIKVKNVSNGPIARLTVDESWYDKGGAVVGGGKGLIQGLLQPKEVKTIVIQTPYSAKMNGNQFMFTHANGTVKPTRVKSLDEAKEPAAQTAATTKQAPKKKGKS